MVTVVCLVLLALLTVAQVVHVHPVESAADNCPLCIVMHTAAPVAVTATVVVLVHIESAAPIFETRTVTRYWHPQLFTRPPPNGLLG
jgi:AhpD family alkylhydroperoxidase